MDVPFERNETSSSLPPSVSSVLSTNFRLSLSSSITTWPFICRCRTVKGSSMKSESATTKSRPGLLDSARWPGPGFGDLSFSSTATPLGKAVGNVPENAAARMRGRPSALKPMATFSNGPALAAGVATVPAVAPLSATRASRRRRFSAPAMRVISPGSMKANSRRSAVSGEFWFSDSLPTEKAGGYCTGWPRELRMGTERWASPTTASTSTLTPQARSSAGSEDAPSAIGATMNGMPPCWNFW